MKRFTITCCAAVLLFSCGENKSSTDPKKDDTTLTGSNASSDEAKSEKWIPVDSATMEKAMIEVGTPGPEHAMLAKSAGTWNAQMTYWSSDGAAPMVSQAVATNRMVYNGRYQEETIKGNFGDRPYEGSGVTGYDKAEKVYFTTWMDNMGTGMMSMKGTWDEPGKSITFKGKFLCPANGQWCEMRQVYRLVDDNTQVMEMYGPDMKTGKEFKGMEVKFTRK